MRFVAVILALVWAGVFWTAARGQVDGADLAATVGPLTDYNVVAGAIPGRLGGRVGNPDRGRSLVLDRAVGNCLICHKVPVENEPFQGDLGPDLSGVGSRLTSGEIRLSLVDRTMLNPDTLMPPYYRIDGLTRVAPKYRGRPVLTAQQVEDVIAWLSTLN